MASEAYHDWSGEAAGAQLCVNFTLKLLLSQNFCNWALMRFISFASNIGPAAAVHAGPALAPLKMRGETDSQEILLSNLKQVQSPSITCSLHNHDYS